MSRFHPIENKNLPKLAWLAQYDLTNYSLKIVHGEAVEHGSDWVVEGIWDGDFKQADFHKSENFFGSGVRLEGDSVYFVPAKSLVDRLFYCVFRHQLLVSNCLFVLMAFTGARLDPKHDYSRETFTILDGIKKYNPDYTIKHQELFHFKQLFYCNLVVTGDRIAISALPKTPEIKSYRDYVALLGQALEKMRVNLESRERAFPVSSFCTISSGYDSVAVAALVKRIGVKNAFTSRESNSVLPTWLDAKRTIDDGTPIAENLGYQTQYLSNVTPGDDEIFFLAASCAGPELIFYSMTEHIKENCQVAAVFTGAYGGVVWDVKTDPKDFDEDIIRKDTSNLNLCELRLQKGFFQVAVPFMYSRSIRDLVAISRSEEMGPWRLFNDYDKPLARRIAEEEGVGRDMFGMRKKAVTRYYSFPQNPLLRKKYFTYLRQEYNLPVFLVYLYNFFINYPTIIIGGILYNIGLGKLIDKNTRPGLLFSRLMFVWAANTLADDCAGGLTRFWEDDKNN